MLGYTTYNKPHFITRSLLFLFTIGQIVESLGGSADEHDVFVSLFSVMNAVGRLAFGFLPELCMYKYSTPR